jgi:hypothetical protein
MRPIMYWPLTNAQHITPSAWLQLSQMHTLWGSAIETTNKSTPQTVVSMQPSHLRSRDCTRSASQLETLNVFAYGVDVDDFWLTNAVFRELVHLSCGTFVFMA